MGMPCPWLRIQKVNMAWNQAAMNTTGRKRPKNWTASTPWKTNCESSPDGESMIIGFICSRNAICFMSRQHSFMRRRAGQSLNRKLSAGTLA